MRRHPIRSQQVTVVAATAMLFAGSWLLWDAYERRGRFRPWFTRMIPGA
ncbi:hypothetical protein Q6348_08085 [Isoptericola sp. b441]|uniref:Uncharacterized protein n=1 Tax=Actinotalea lenta TaxID=3064654 RepID=A0ABT9DA60_9CELL|nr:hypothetical protein [Isoptericola sp. b441]MDO8107154.1 hypothetical protein [Isoptericola sp. b441]